MTIRIVILIWDDTDLGVVLSSILGPYAWYENAMSLRHTQPSHSECVVMCTP